MSLVADKQRALLHLGATKVTDSLTVGGLFIGSKPEHEAQMTCSMMPQLNDHMFQKVNSNNNCFG